MNKQKKKKEIKGNKKIGRKSRNKIEVDKDKKVAWEMYCNGYTYKKIAEKLKVVDSTIKKYLDWEIKQHNFDHKKDIDKIRTEVILRTQKISEQASIEYDENKNDKIVKKRLIDTVRYGVPIKEKIIEWGNGGLRLQSLEIKLKAQDLISKIYGLQKLALDLPQDTKINLIINTIDNENVEEEKK